MLQTSTRTKSRSKHKIQKIKKCNRLSPNSSLINLHQLQYSLTAPLSMISDKSPQLSLVPPCCGFNYNKLVIYLLLFIVAYYLLILSFTSKNKHHHNPLATILSETPKNIPDINIDYDPTKTETNDKKLQQNQSQREKFLERKRKRREQRKSRLAALRGENSETNNAEKGEKRKPILTYSELAPFPQLYISDAPYYLDNNIVITGQVNNAESHLQSTLAQLLSVSCLYNSTTFILFESNSIDNTSLYLNEFLHGDNDINCTQKMFNPTHVEKYGNVSRTLDALINIFDSSFEQYVHENNSLEYVDERIYDVLSNYSDLHDVDVKEMEWYLEEQIRLQTNKLSDIRIEEIIYDKLAVIKYVRYHDSIVNSMNTHHLHKYVISGDEIVGTELEKELEILSVLNMYDGVNEFHTDTEIEKKIQKRNKINTLSDFESEFSAIHNDIEGLMAGDEQILYEKLRDKQLQFAKRKKAMRAKQFRKLEMAMKDEEFYHKFRDKLYRIERFVAYRNMILNETYKKSMEMRMNFDYVMLIDMDIYNIDIRTFLNELYYSSDDINGLCIDGLDWLGYTRDTFATVDRNGGWLHYGHDPLLNDTEYIYNNEHALHQRKLIPNAKENNRFFAVKSCFGGLIAYKNYMPQNDLFASQCRYTLTRDIFYTTYNDTDVERYSYEWWLQHRYHNKYSQESKSELELFRKEYIEILQMENKRIKNREMFPRDGDICEHIPYHYCLNDYGWKFAISSRAKLFYDKKYPNFRNDTNWNYYFQNTPSFTK